MLLLHKLPLKLKLLQKHRHKQNNRLKLKLPQRPKLPQRLPPSKPIRALSMNRRPRTALLTSNRLEPPLNRVAHRKPLNKI